MATRRATGLTRIGGALITALALVAAGAGIVRGPDAASASPPSALALADHALTSPSLVADESPYELIDPVGPGGITREQALNEVTASTMIGGLYNDNARGYGGSYFMPINANSGQGGYSR